MAVSTLDCTAVDELAPAYALGAVEADEDRAVSTHLASCDGEHREARELVEAAAILPAALEPVLAGSALRSRIMTSVAAEPRGVGAVARASAHEPRRRSWWSFGALPSAVAAAALVAAVGFGAWGVSLNNRVAERDEIVRAIAAADAVYRADGAAGEGWLIESGGQAMFMAEDLADLPADHIYELWLIHEDGTVVDVGALNVDDGLLLATLETGLTGAVQFAITVEPHRVDAPTGDPVLRADIGA